MSIFDGKSVLITGGTGSFGQRMVRTLLSLTPVERVIVFSRDELKQHDMSLDYAEEPRIRFFIGDVRDLDRLRRAFDGVDYVIHAAALKQVAAAEYNPFEAVKTNVYGAQNVIDAAIDHGIQRVIALSTDKASSPVNLYGATKLVSDKLFVAGNAYAGRHNTRLSVVRYGNVAGSRGSVLVVFRKLAPTGVLPITDQRMTRFWITLQQGVEFVMSCMERMVGGEIFVPKIPSVRVVDLARAVAPHAELKITGIRPGEKLHEEMLSEHTSQYTLDMGRYFIIQPATDWWEHVPNGGEPVPEGFCYSSDHNDHWLDVESLQAMIADV